VNPVPDRQAAKLDTLLDQIRGCNLCAPHLDHAPRPVLRASHSARILVIGQAPGTRVHASGIPWNDASGNRLRQWMGVDAETFYDQAAIAIVPMGFCYPGRGRSGDLPPRPECAPAWHAQILALMPAIETTLLIGQYSQHYYQRGNYATLTERVKDWRRFAPRQFVLPHPSPRNQLWLRKNPWFEDEVVPALQKAIHPVLKRRAAS
jgi:uracil-DNA glycosylase